MNPWTWLGWIALVILGLAYIGGVWELWSMTRRRSLSTGRKAAAYVMALIWPVGLGSLCIRAFETARW